MLVLSIDVGIKNLAMCLIDGDTKVVQEWDVSGVPPEHEDGLFISLRTHLDNRPWVLSAPVILIEKQPERNRKMQMVEHFLNAYFVIKVPQYKTILWHAKNKVPDVIGPGRAKYRERKATSVVRCHDFLKQQSPDNSRWLKTFETSKKKDDLADTVLQALSYLSATPLVPVNKKVTKKIVARKPNENQARTKYSQSNLLWLMKNTDEEKLKKDKRFMKDLGRYYRSIDELKDLLNS
jgi:hypothetical protein